jgi:membrane protein
MARRARFSQVLSTALTLGFVFRRIVKHRSEPHAIPYADTRGNQPEQGRKLPDAAGPGSAEKPEAVAPKPSGAFAILKRAVNRFIDDDCPTMAAALAYYTTFSLAPLLLIIISVVGLIFGREAVQHDIQGQIQALIGQGPASQVGSLVQNAGQHSSSGVVGTILGVLALLFGASGCFSQLQSSLNQIWHVKPDPRVGGIRNFVTHRILSFGMIMAIAFLLVVSLAVTAALSAFGDFISAYLPRGFSGPLLQVLGFVASLAVITTLFAAMFKVLPDAKIRWRDVWIGAGLTALLFTIGKFLIGMYLGHSGTASAYGAAGSLVLVVLWIYYSSMIFLFGAEFTAVWSQAHSGAVQPKPGAVQVTTEEKLEPKHAA